MFLAAKIVSYLHFSPQYYELQARRMSRSCRPWQNMPTKAARHVHADCPGKLMLNDRCPKTRQFGIQAPVAINCETQTGPHNALNIVFDIGFLLGAGHDGEEAAGQRCGHPVHPQLPAQQAPEDAVQPGLFQPLSPHPTLPVQQRGHAWLNRHKVVTQENFMAA